MTKDARSARNRAFEIHAFIFAATIALLIAINFVTGKPYWVVWPILGWGIGLLAHWWFTLGPGKSSTTSDRE